MKIRAVDPTIATLILIVVVAVSSIAAYSFVSEFVGQTAAQEQNPSKFVIDAAVLYDDGTSDLYVRNLSDEPIEIVSVMVMDAANLRLINEDDVSETVPAHSVLRINAFPSISGVTVGEWYVIKVVSSDGSSAAIKVRCQSP